MSATSSTSSATLSPQLMSLLNGTSKQTGSTGKSASPTSAQSIQNEFLTLFTTQLKNQDPLNPMDSSQMTSQLAQISTVSGVQQLDNTLQTMMTSNTALETAQSAGLIGHQVMGPGSTFNLPATGGTELGVSLQSPADSVKLTILNSQGVPVQAYDLGAQSNTVVTLPWDGSNSGGGSSPAGNYSVNVQATLNGKSVTATPLVQGKVIGVTSSSAGISLDVAGIGSVALGTVARVD
jgi:flagellar basal-body rod modification protein FlgD